MYPAAGRTVRKAVANLGPAPGGVTGAIFVATADYTEYIVKAPSLSAQVGPFIPANELIAAELATLVGVPTLPWQLIELPNGDLGFGSLRLPHGDFTAMSPTIATQLVDADMFNDVAVLDLWICNSDRHRGNLLARRIRVGQYGLLANDHSHSLVRGAMNPLNLSAEVGAVPVDRFFSCAELRQGVTDGPRIRAALDRVESMEEDHIRNVVAGVPGPWMGDQEKQAVADLLVTRARRIRSVFHGAVSLFPNLAGVLP